MKSKVKEYKEKHFTKEIIKLARRHGWKIAHFRAGMMANGRWITPIQGDGKGFPDTILCRGRQSMAAELKMPGQEPKTEQYQWLLSLALTGIPTTLWSPDNWDKIIYQLENGL